MVAGRDIALGLRRIRLLDKALDREGAVAARDGASAAI
jgi:hypothetical protein